MAAVFIKKGKNPADEFGAFFGKTPSYSLVVNKAKADGGGREILKGLFKGGQETKGSEVKGSKKALEQKEKCDVCYGDSTRNDENEQQLRQISTVGHILKMARMIAIVVATVLIFNMTLNMVLEHTRWKRKEQAGHSAEEQKNHPKT